MCAFLPLKQSRQVALKEALCEARRAININSGTSKTIFYSMSLKIKSIKGNLQSAKKPIQLSRNFPNVSNS